MSTGRCLGCAGKRQADKEYQNGDDFHGAHSGNLTRRTNTIGRRLPLTDFSPLRPCHYRPVQISSLPTQDVTMPVKSCFASTPIQQRTLRIFNFLPKSVQDCTFLCIGFGHYIARHEERTQPKKDTQRHLSNLRSRSRREM
jgi:hypothetical protein